MDVRLLALYFFVGGTVVTLTSYFGSAGKGLIAAFVAFIPSITIVTLCSIYLTGGIASATAYARGMLLLLPAWTLYALSLYFILPRLGLVPAILIGASLYVGGALVIIRLVR